MNKVGDKTESFLERQPLLNLKTLKNSYNFSGLVFQRETVFSEYIK